MPSFFLRLAAPSVHVLLVLGVCLVPGGVKEAGAQQTDAIPFNRFTVRSGLPHASVTALAEGEDGRLWIGTRIGVAVYDGSRFSTVPLPASLQSTSISSLASTPDGSVWVGVANRGVVRVHPRLDAPQRVLSSTSLSDVAAHGDTVAAISASTLWLRPPGRSQFQAHPVPYTIHPPALLPESPQSGGGLYDLAFAPDGTLWVLDGRFGPGSVNDNGTIDFLGLRAPADGLWEDLGVTPDGRLIATRRDGQRLVSISPDTGGMQTHATGLRGTLDVFCTDRAAFISEVGGLRRFDFDANTIRPPYGQNRGLPPHHPTTVLQDRTGTLWIGTRTGLLHVSAPSVRHVTRIQGMDLLNPNQFMTGTAGQLWLQTYGTGLVQLRPQRAVDAPGGERGWGQGVQSATDTIHAVSRSSWYRRPPGASWQRVGPSRGAVRGHVDRTGTGLFWHDDGLYEHRPDRPDPTPLLQWPAEERGRYVTTHTPDGRVLVRTPRHLIQVQRSRPGRPTRLDTLADLSAFAPSRGRYMTATARGHVWIPFQTGGLLHLTLQSDAPSPHLHMEHEAMESATVVQDTLLLAAARTGLYGIDAHSGTQYFHLTGADGLLATDVNGATVFGDSLYASHTTGLTVLPMAAVLHRPPVPEAILTQLHVNGRRRPVADTLTLSADERRLTVRFAAPYLRNPHRVTFETRMLPDTTWYPSQTGVRTFSTLPSGTHRFSVRARIGTSLGRPAHLTVHVPPRLTETAWFWLLCGVALLGVCAVGMRWRVRHMVQQRKELEQTVAERTEALRAEKRTTEMQAAHLARLDATKNRFFANLSHEFRTPLTLILGPLNHLLENDDLPADVRTDLSAMRRNGTRLKRLIGQLLDLSRLTAGRMDIQRQPVDLVAFSRECVRAFAPYAESESVTLKFQAEDDTLPAETDPSHLDKMLGNLLSNAIKFTPEGGRVWLTLRRDQGADGPVVQWVVKDTGPGIDDEDLARIFNRFEQVDGTSARRHEGTGIGLSLTQELVHLHEGTIGVESEPGRGSAFTIRLPLRSADPEPEASHSPSDALQRSAPTLPPPSPRTRPTGGSDTDGSATASPVVLVVDDNADVRAFLRRHLNGYRVREAETGDAALAQMRERRPDIVVSDVMMPGMDGNALCRAIRADEALQTIPILLLTARAGAKNVAGGLENGADDYLTKPFDVDELRSRIARLIQARREMEDIFSRTLHVEPADLDVDDADAAFITAVLTAVEEALGDPDFTVDDLADAVALSRRQLTRRLRDATDETPGAFIRRLRLERAAEHVRNGTYGTISELAYSVGFRSASHFTTVFKKTFGCPPSRYPQDEEA